VRSGHTSDGEAVEICEELHAERPYVRPPADTLADDGSSILYLAALDSNYSGFVDREGTRYRTVDADGDPLGVDALPSSLHAPSKRNLFLIYRVSGSIGAVADEGDDVDASIHIAEIEPAILITGEAIDGAFVGAWEGTVSVREDDETCTLTTPCWDSTEQVPLRVSFDDLEQVDDLGIISLSGEKLPDGNRFMLVGTIENVHDPVVLSDGTCAPSLRSLADGDPFRPSDTGDLTLVRLPAMHTEVDDVILLEYPVDTEGLGGASGMSPLNVLHPGNLLQLKSTTEWHRISIHNHGVPNGSEINLEPVAAGGGACTP
jgi:hypothetical protein